MNSCQTGLNPRCISGSSIPVDSHIEIRRAAGAAPGGIGAGGCAAAALLTAARPGTLGGCAAAVLLAAARPTTAFLPLFPPFHPLLASQVEKGNLNSTKINNREV
ncbi:hypothetical protein PGRAT_09145 [Paenibacillus graminis]|uniref:Uncharacterized protein n=1 Tax=Paenibacillus graminis TaxID=189425 RepID=A0A089NFK2_9BACL|nr:hypothetical protein PGRAT_09145 [Paenibacillus graminis]